MSVRGAALLAMASQMGAFAIQFMASVVLARWFIAPDELGLFTIAFSFVSLLAVLQEFGINRFVAGEPDLDDDKLHTAFTVSLIVSWAIAALCVLLAWPAAAFYAMPGLLPLLLVIAASYFFVPKEMVANPPSPDRAVRLGGMVQAGTLTTLEDGVTISFVVGDGEADRSVR